MTPSDTSNVLPEAAAATLAATSAGNRERARQGPSRPAGTRSGTGADPAHRRVSAVVEIDFRDGVKNRRSPEYLMIHGLPPEAANETHEDWVSRIHPEDRERTVKHLFDAS